MLTGDLVRVRISKERVIPLYLNRSSPQWLEAMAPCVWRPPSWRRRGWLSESSQWGPRTTLPQHSAFPSKGLSRLRKAFDPEGRMNPGRSVTG